MRLILAEDETLLREGLALVFERAGFDVVGAVAGADDLLDLVEREQPDVVVTDIRMPPDHTDDGLRAAVRIRRRWPKVGILVLSQHVQRSYAVELIGTGPAGVGYLLKERVGDLGRFVEDVKQIGSGGTVLDPEVVAAMMARASRRPNGLERLTARQRDVLALIAEGRTNAAIAQRLNIAEKSVVQHASRIYDDLGLAVNPVDHRRVLAVIRFLEGSTSTT